MAPGVDADAEDREVLRREDQLRNKKEKKNKKGDSSKPKPKSKSRKGKGKKKTTSALDKPTAKPGAKARKLLRSAKKKKQDSEEGEVGDEGTAATAAPQQRLRQNRRRQLPRKVARPRPSQVVRSQQLATMLSHPRNVSGARPASGKTMTNFTIKSCMRQSRIMFTNSLLRMRATNSRRK